MSQNELTEKSADNTSKISDEQRLHTHTHAHRDAGERFAEDLVYTLNHAIVCATSDVFDPFIGSATQKYLGTRLVMNPLHDWAHNKFEHHDHDHHHHDNHHAHHDHHGHHEHHDHHHHEHSLSFIGNLKHWVAGEIVGDVGAVPFTLAMQHYTPGIMRGIQNLTEPLIGPAFNWSANRYARKWAHENGLDENAPEVGERARELYQHEVEHLPHAFVWTGSAAGLNILTQKYITKNPGKTSHLIYGKALGSIGTLGLVLGLRSLAPKKIQQLDEWNTKNLAEPITRRVSRLFGIDETTVDRVLEREREFEDGHQLIEKSKKEKSDDSTRENDKGEARVDSSPEPQIHSRSAHVSRPFSLLRLVG